MFDLALKYMRQCIGKPYGFWGRGELELDDPMWTRKDPPPEIKDIKNISCSGLINLGNRAAGIDFRAGTFGYQNRNDVKPFDSNKRYKPGVLLGSFFIRDIIEGHISVVSEENKVLSSDSIRGVNELLTINDIIKIFRIDYVIEDFYKE